MSEHSNSKNSNYSNFSFGNYLKNPADIGKNEYENCQNNNLEEFTESFHSSENYQSENIPNFGVAPKFVSAGFGSSPTFENVTKIEFVEDTKSDLKVTSLHDTGLGPNYITESIAESVPKVESPHGTEIGPSHLAQSIDYNKSLIKATSLHDTGLGPNYKKESVDKSVPKVELPHGTEIGPNCPNYIIHSIDYNKSLTKATSPHGIGLGPNYITESIAESVPKVELPHGTEIGPNCPNYITYSIDYTKSLTKATSPHGIGLGPNYVTESVENTKSVPAYNTGLMVNNINTSTSEPLHKIISYKESHNSSFDNSNNEFEKFIQFTKYQKIINHSFFS